MVYIADCNLDKDGKVMEKYLAAGARACLPSDIKTTLASHHGAAKFGAKPDRVMVFQNARGNYPYRVSDVHMDDSPGSDHLMLCTTVTREG